MKDEEATVDNVAHGPKALIEYFDSNRPPVKPYLFAYPSIFSGFRKRYYVKKYDQKFYNGVKKEIEWYNRQIQMPRRSILVTAIIFILALLTSGVIGAAFNLVSRIYYAAIMLSFLLGFLYYVHRVLTGIREKLGEENDKRLKDNAQDIINYMRNFLGKENLKPENFSLELRHNDYMNLEYCMKTNKNPYTSYIKIKEDS